MTDPFYGAEPDAAPEGASIRYSVTAGVLYLVTVAVVALVAGQHRAMKCFPTADKTQECEGPLEAVRKFWYCIKRRS
jgi:hypothetical protein